VNVTSTKSPLSTAKARTTSEKAEILKKTELFAHVSDEIVTDVAFRTITRQLRPGEVLFSEHDKATTLFIVVEGALRSIRQNKKGREQVLSTDGPGSILGAVPIFSDGNFYSTTIADSPCQVLCVDGHDVLSLCQQHTELLWAVTRLFAHQVRHFAELIETLALRNVNQRVAQHIYVTCQQQGVGHEDTCTIEIKMTQAEMASRVGSTREVVCRALAFLEGSGLIQMASTRSVKVLSVKGLAKFAGVHHEIEEPLVISELSAHIA
jgi:CRP/FNR family cyclic AMP-dependent transcriptional regulator